MHNKLRQNIQPLIFDFSTCLTLKVHMANCTGQAEKSTRNRARVRDKIDLSLHMVRCCLCLFDVVYTTCAQCRNLLTTR